VRVQIRADIELDEIDASILLWGLEHENAVEEMCDPTDGLELLIVLGEGKVSLRLEELKRKLLSVINARSDAEHAAKRAVTEA
jgi:hypothetical protein